MCIYMCVCIYIGYGSFYSDYRAALLPYRGDAVLVCDGANFPTVASSSILRISYMLSNMEIWYYVTRGAFKIDVASPRRACKGIA